MLNMADFKRSSRSRSGGRGFRRSGGRDFNRPSFRSGDGDMPHRREFGRPNRTSELEMHEATCDECGKQCQVPFKPNNNKPVYCNNCFRKHDSRLSRDETGNTSSGELERINAIGELSSANNK